MGWCGRGAVAGVNDGLLLTHDQLLTSSAAFSAHSTSSVTR